MGTVTQQAAAMRSVVYLISDDLRTSVPAYAHDAARSAASPHLSSLAASSLVFEQAYAQIAVCLPSRNYARRLGDADDELEVASCPINGGTSRS